MPSRTTLGDLVNHIGDLDESLTIYAPLDRPLGPESPAVAAFEPEDRSTPAEAAGLAYLLEVDTAKEVIGTWSKWHDNVRPSILEAVAAVVHFADTDSYCHSLNS